MSEYITINNNKNLLGKRAKFKKDPRYCKECWKRKGKIIQEYQIIKGDLDHVGLSLKFDEISENKMKSCYIMPNSIELEEKGIKVEE